MSSEILEAKSGFTWRSFLIMIFTIVIFTPVTVWLTLSIGVGGGIGAYSFAILLLCIELSHLFGSPLTKQEVATVFVAMGAINVGYGISLIQPAYFSQSEILEFFGLRGRIPYWVAPLPESGFYSSRSFLHPMYMPTWLNLLGILVPSAATFAGLSLGILNKVLYVDEEKLPYPGVQVNAAFCTTLTEREHSRLNVFSLAFLVASAYGVLVYTIPMITGWRIIPMLWIDLSPQVQRYLPGACFGIATDLQTLLPAFILPFHVIISMVIGSISIWVFGNWYVVSHGLTEFSKMYFQGMPLYLIYTWSSLYVWMFPIIGLGVFVGFSALRPGAVRGAFSSLRKAGRAGGTGAERLFSIWLVIIPFTVVILGSLLTIWYRAPDYPGWPWLPLSYMVVMSLSTALLAGRAAGTGINVAMPGNLSNLILVATDYKGFSGWFVSPSLVGYSFGGPVDQNFKLAQLTGSTFTGFLKLFFIVYPISLVSSVFFTQTFWSTAQIPSSAYPWSLETWPLGVMNSMVWVTRPKGIFHLDWMIAGALAGLLAYGGFSLLRLPAATILVSFLGGMNTLPPMAMNILIGYLLRLLLERLVGKATFDNHKYTIVAGLTAGNGVAIAIGVSGLLINSALLTPSI